MKSFPMLFLISVLLGFAGCIDSAQPLQPTQQPRPPLQQKQPTGILGWWNWVGSDGGRITPETEGFTEKERFDADGMWYGYINDTLSWQTSYKIEWERVFYYPTDSANVLKIYNSFTRRWIRWALEFRTDDTMVWHPLATDAGDQMFARMTRRHY